MGNCRCVFHLNEKARKNHERTDEECAEDCSELDIEDGRNQHAESLGYKTDQ